MIFVTKVINDTEIGINPDQIVAIDPSEAEGVTGSYILLRGDYSNRIKETPREVEDLISNHHSKYTRG